MRKLIPVTLLAALLGANAHAELYKRVDEQGNVTYGDQPGGQAKPVQPGGLTTYSPPTRHTQPSAARPNTDTQKSADQAVTNYSGLAITSPAKDEVVRSNEGNIAVKIGMTPALDATAGHQLVVLLDQKPLAKVPAAETLLKNVDRGTHTLRVQIIDAKGKVLAQSADITVHMQRGTAIKH